MASESEVKAVTYVLEQDHEGKSSAQVAELCIKALDDVRSTIWRPVGGPLHLGDLFKGAINAAQIHYVAWIGKMGSRERAWIVTQTSEFGWIGHPGHEQWSWRKPATLKDMSKITDNVDGHKVGDMFMYGVELMEVVAVSPRSALVADGDFIFPIPNSDLGRFYRKVSV